MYRLTTLACLTVFLSVPLFAAQRRPAKLPVSPSDAISSCSRLGEVMGRDVFAQTFLLKPDDGQMETVPFSRWTWFFKISLDSRDGRPREIEPTDIRLGDRLCAVLDPTEATAKLILILERVTGPFNLAAVHRASVRYRLTQAPAIGFPRFGPHNDCSQWLLFHLRLPVSYGMWQAGLDFERTSMAERVNLFSADQAIAE